MSEVQFSFDALSFLQEVLPEPEEATPTESIIRRPTEPKPVEAKDENQTMLQDFARLQADQYDLKSMKKAPPVKSNLIQDYLDNLDMFYKDEQMNEAINSALMEATRPPIGQMSDTARTAMFSGADMRGSELTMMNNAREAQDVVQPMVTPVSRGRQPEMADSPAPVDTPSIDARSNEMLDKPKGIMNRPEVVTAEVEPLTDDDMGLPSDADFTAKDAQKALGFTGSAVDGKFGPNSRKRLLEFQRKSGIPLTGDFNDPATRAALMNPDSTDPRKVESIYASPDLTTSGSIDIDKVTGYIKTIVQNPLKAAGIIGIIRQELGEGSIRTEDMGYRLGKKATANSPATGAYAVFDDSDVDAAFASLSTTEQTKAKTNVPMNALGRAIMDIKYDGGHQYRGRGLVQITHKDMYKQVGDKIGVDLVANPELVNDPEYAVPAAIALLEIKDYFGKPTTKDNLRRMINPGQTDAKRDDRWQYVEAALSDIRTS
jgi:peptidoglycan hydrolase-like protein with peptidoglycan-binding domain